MGIITTVPFLVELSLRISTCSIPDSKSISLDIMEIVTGVLSTVLTASSTAIGRVFPTSMYTKAVSHKLGIPSSQII